MINSSKIYSDLTPTEIAELLYPGPEDRDGRADIERLFAEGLVSGAVETSARLAVLPDGAEYVGPHPPFNPQGPCVIACAYCDPREPAMLFVREGEYTSNFNVPIGRAEAWRFLDELDIEMPSASQLPTRWPRPRKSKQMTVAEAAAEVHILMRKEGLSQTAAEKKICIRENRSPKWISSYNSRTKKAKTKRKARANGQQGGDARLRVVKS